MWPSQVRRETGGWSQGSFSYSAPIHVRSPRNDFSPYDLIFHEASTAPPVAASDEATLDLSWLLKALEAGRETCAMDVLSRLIVALGDLLSDENYEAIDLIIRSVDIRSVSPEVMLAFARTSFAARHRLAEWKNLVQSVRQELGLRGLDADRVLRGLV